VLARCYPWRMAIEVHGVVGTLDSERAIEDILRALKGGVGAASVGVLDDDRGQVALSSEEGAAGFWDAFRGLACLQIDWTGWYHELRLRRRVTTPCRCGRQHALSSVLLHERWALVVVAHGPLAEGAQTVIASAARALADLLPLERWTDGHFAGHGPAALGLPATSSRRRS
jgi:hypothetical protein